LIIIKAPDEDKRKEVEKLKEIVELNDWDENKSLVVYDNERLIGFASYLDLNDTVGVLNNFFVDKEYTKKSIGDGLIKALLNLAEKNGIRRLYVPSPLELSLFFNKVGLTKISFPDDDIAEKLSRYISTKDILYVADLPDFFLNRKCNN